MNPVRGIETPGADVTRTKSAAFKLMNPVRGIETNYITFYENCDRNFQINESRSRDWNIVEESAASNHNAAFKLMNPVRGIETNYEARNFRPAWSFKLMNPVRGIET